MSPSPIGTPPDTAPHRTLTPIKLLALAGATLAMLLPFVGKPLHIDDPVYIWTARQIVAHPLDFYGFKINWEGTDIAVSSFCENPPGVAYWLAAVSHLVGWSETGFHAAFLPFAILSILGTYRLATRFCRRPGTVALMLLACPVFVVSSTTLMCEPPVLCLWIWTICVWINGTDRRPLLLPVAGLLAAAAVMTKYSALAVLPLMVLYAAVTPGSIRLRIAQGLSLLIPAAAIIGYEIITARLYGAGALGAASKYVADSHAYLQIPRWLAILNTVTFVGGAAVPVALAAVPLFGRRANLILAAAVVVLTIVAASFIDPPPAWIDPAGGAAAIWKAAGFFIQAVLLTAFGASIAAMAYAAARRAVQTRLWRDDAFLIGWILGVGFFTGVVNWSVNARSVLPMLPPVCVLLGRAIDRRPIPKIWLTASVIAGVVLSLIVARADFDQAAMAKTAAEQLTAGVQPPVRFVGHWGFQFYMQQHGGRIVDEIHPDVTPGERIIYPQSGMGGKPGSTGLILVKTVRFTPDPSCITERHSAGGGFYSSFGRSLPFVFGHFPAETFDVMQVTPQTKIKP